MLKKYVFRVIALIGLATVDATNFAHNFKYYSKPHIRLKTMVTTTSQKHLFPIG